MPKVENFSTQKTLFYIIRMYGMQSSSPSDSVLFCFSAEQLKSLFQGRAVGGGVGGHRSWPHRFLLISYPCTNQEGKHYFHIFRPSKGATRVKRELMGHIWSDKNSSESSWVPLYPQQQSIEEFCYIGSIKLHRYVLNKNSMTEKVILRCLK